MRYREILEESSKLSAYLNKNAYITFRFVKELKVPLPTDVNHMDPAGIYTYPLDLCWELIKGNKLSFMDRPYLHILQPTKKVWKMSEITMDYFDKAVSVILNMMPDMPESLSNNEKHWVVVKLSNFFSICPKAKESSDPWDILKIIKEYLNNPESIVWEDCYGDEIPEDQRAEYITRANDCVKKCEEMLNSKGESTHDILNPLIGEIKESNKVPGSKLWYLVTAASEISFQHHDTELAAFSRDVFLKMGMNIIEDDVGSQIGGTGGNEKYQAVFLTDDSYKPLALFDN